MFFILDFIDFVLIILRYSVAISAASVS